MWDVGATMDTPSPGGGGTQDGSPKGPCGTKTKSHQGPAKSPLDFSRLGSLSTAPPIPVLPGQTPCWEQTLLLLPKPQRPLIKNASQQTKQASASCNNYTP